MTYLMALLHSLIDNLKIKNRCHQRAGVTLNPQYLRYQAGLAITWLLGCSLASCQPILYYSSFLLPQPGQAHLKNEMLLELSESVRES
jgi:hypothetical protein